MLLIGVSLANPLSSPIGDLSSIQCQFINQSFAEFVVVDDSSVVQDFHARPVAEIFRRRQSFRSLSAITVRAGVSEVGVFAAELWRDALGYLVIQFVIAVMGTPLLTFQAIDAAEIELIPKPRTVMLIFRVTDGAMFPPQW